MTPDEAPPPTHHEARLADRSLFPDLQARAYLNHAAISPPSLAVRDAARRVLDDYAGRGAAAFPTWIAQRERLRAVLARLIGAGAEDIGLVQNTTQGIIDVALCYPWTAGDRVLLFEGEFPANVTPWQRAAEMFDLDLRFIPPDAFERSHDEGLDALERELAGGLRMVATSFVRFQTGLRMPVERMARLCHRHGAEIVVDGVQGCGAVPIDVSAAGIDYLSCGGHKWLMGTEGAGMLYVHPERIGALRPNLAGWMGHHDALSFLFRGAGHLRHDRPLRAKTDVFEPGSQNAAGYAGLEAAVELILQLGTDAVHAHVGRYLDALEAGLTARGFRSLRPADPAARSGILGVLPPDGTDVTELLGELSHRGIACTMPDGVLRFAPHWPNDPSEVDIVLEVVDEALAEVQRRGGRAAR